MPFGFILLLIPPFGVHGTITLDQRCPVRYRRRASGNDVMVRLAPMVMRGPRAVLCLSQKEYLRYLLDCERELLHVLQCC